MLEVVATQANVRDARLHDAQHTAATMFLVLKVPLPADMEIMGWSDPNIAKAHMHVTEELVTAIAHDVGELLWTGRPASNWDGHDEHRQPRPEAAGVWAGQSGGCGI